MLTWNLQNPFSGLYLHAIFLLGSVRVVYSDCTPEQLAAIMNCSKHERHTRNYDYMEGGDVRIRQLFSRTQWFLTIDDRGNITGTQDATDCNSKDGSYCLIVCFLLALNFISHSADLALEFEMFLIVLRRVELWNLSTEPVKKKIPLACQGDRSTWEVLLYTGLHSVITVLMSEVSALEQPKWRR